MYGAKIESLVLSYCSCIGSNSISHGERAIIHHRKKEHYSIAHMICGLSEDKKLTFFCTRRVFVVYYLLERFFSQTIVVECAPLFFRWLWFHSWHFLFIAETAPKANFHCSYFKYLRKKNALIQVHNSHFPHLLVLRQKLCVLFRANDCKEFCTIKTYVNYVV